MHILESKVDWDGLDT